MARHQLVDTDFGVLGFLMLRSTSGPLDRLPTSFAWHAVDDEAARLSSLTIAATPRQRGSFVLPSPVGTADFGQSVQCDCRCHRMIESGGLLEKSSELRERSCRISPALCFLSISALYSVRRCAA
jgi:hypothetical protein